MSLKNRFRPPKSPRTREYLPGRPALSQRGLITRNVRTRVTWGHQLPPTLPSNKMIEYRRAYERITRCFY